jgi:hypothetical protein
MKKIFSLLVAIAAFTVVAVHAQNQVIYLPEGSVTTSVSDLTNFLPSNYFDYSLEVQGTVGTQISVAGAYTYTPTSNGTVRFVQKSGKVYVYEGSVYKTSLTPVALTVSYPTVTDADPFTNNLLQNASFETTGGLVSGSTTNYLFGTPWVTNATIGTSGGIRIGTSTSAVNGTYVCVWRGSGNTNYFYQPISSTVKPSTYYKVILRQIAGGNATAYFNIGLGSTVDGMEYAQNQVKLGNGLNGTISGELVTSPTTTGTVNFTFKNTSTNTASSGSDPVTQFDYISLIEGTPTTKGITGVTSANYLVGTAYAPVGWINNVNYAAGDTVNMTSLITNPSFESSFTGWTNTGSFTTQTNTPLFTKDGSTYIEKYIAPGSAVPDCNSTQTLSNLPTGSYTLIVAAAARINQNGTNPAYVEGAYIYAKNSTDSISQVVSTAKDYYIHQSVSGGTLKIGFKTQSSTANWVSADNFRLFYKGQGVPTGVSSISSNTQTFQVFSLANGLLIKSEKTVDVKIYTVLGQLVKAVKVLDGSTTVNLPKGVYLVNGIKAVVR